MVAAHRACLRGTSLGGRVGRRALVLRKVQSRVGPGTGVRRQGLPVHRRHDRRIRLPCGDRGGSRFQLAPGAARRRACLVWLVRRRVKSWLRTRWRWLQARSAPTSRMSPRRSKPRHGGGRRHRTTIRHHRGATQPRHNVDSRPANHCPTRLAICTTQSRRTGHAIEAPIRRSARTRLPPAHLVDHSP